MSKRVATRGKGGVELDNILAVNEVNDMVCGMSLTTCHEEG